MSWIKPMTWPAVQTCEVGRGNVLVRVGRKRKKGKGGTYTVVWIAVEEYLTATLARDKRGDFFEFPGETFALNADGFFGDTVTEQTAGVAPAAEDELGIGLVGRDDGGFDVGVDGRLDRTHKAGAHVDALCAEAQRCGKSLAVCEPAAGNEGNSTETLSCAAEENEVSDVAFAYVAGALESVDGEEVDPELDC